jgi:membrane protein required for colicin V production
VGWHPVDVALALVVLTSAVLGAWRGLLYEVLSLLSWVAAFFAAQTWASDAAAWLPLGQVGEPWLTMAGFLSVFVCTAFAGGFVAWVVQKLVAQLGLRPVDRTLGAVFGAARGLLLVTLMVLAVGFTPWAEHEVWTSSSGVQALSGGAQQLRQWLPENLMKI